MDVVILGRVGYDLYSEEPNVPLHRARRFSRYLGGSSANMAVGLSRLGARAGLISCLGEDPLSRFLVDFLEAEHVETKHIQRVKQYLPSLCLTEISPPDHFPQVFYRHQPVDTMLDAQEDDLLYAGSGRMFVTNGTSLCASPSRESAYRALDRAKRAGCTVVLDVDYRAMSWRSAADAGLAIRLALPFLDILIGNQTELTLAAGVETLDHATAWLHQAGVPLLVSKLGEQGTRVLTNTDDVYLPPYNVEVVSTIGAGDGFGSGFLYGILQKLPLIDCLHYGNAAAAIVVSGMSCSEAMPTLPEVEAMMHHQKLGASSR